MLGLVTAWHLSRDPLKLTRADLQYNQSNASTHLAVVMASKKKKTVLSESHFKSKSSKLDKLLSTNRRPIVRPLFFLKVRGCNFEGEKKCNRFTRSSDSGESGKLLKISFLYTWCIEGLGKNKQPFNFCKAVLLHIYHDSNITLPLWLNISMKYK